MKHFLFSIIFFACLSCQRSSYTEANKLYKKQTKQFAKMIRQVPLKDSLANMGTWTGTTNFNMRKPNFVIIHHTAQNSCEQTLKTFTNQKTSVSAHYVICRNGTIHHMLNDYLRAWHGGVSKWGAVTDINSSSIGIELDNNGSEPFSQEQINSLIELLGSLKRAYSIPTANFIGHADIAPTRKVDPSIHFPWKQLADAGFGYWYSDTTAVQVSANFNNIEALRLIGYDTRDSSAAIRAFRIHFLQDTLKTVDPPAQKILYSLYQKYW